MRERWLREGFVCLSKNTYSVDDSILKSLDEPQREQVRRHCVFLLMLREEEVVALGGGGRN